MEGWHRLSCSAPHGWGGWGQTGFLLGFEGLCGLGKPLSAGQGLGGDRWGEGYFSEVVKERIS